MEKRSQNANEGKFDFEKAMKRLEKIVEELENGQPPLYKALDLFQEGKNLSKICHKELTRFEQKIQKIIEDEKGAVSFEDFSCSDGENQENNKLT